MSCMMNANKPNAVQDVKPQGSDFDPNRKDWIPCLLPLG